MVPQNKSELKLLFSQDARKALDGIARLFSSFDQREWMPKIVEEVFHQIHSLKSEASFLGYTKVVTDAEQLEDLLVVFLKNPPGEVSWREFRNIYLTLENDLTSILRGVELELSPMQDQRIDNLNDFEKVIVEEARVRGEKLYRIDAEVDDGEPMPYPRLYLLVNNLELQANVLRVIPPLTVLQKEKLRRFSLLITTAAAYPQIRSWVQVNGMKQVGVNLIPLDEVLGKDRHPEVPHSISPYPRYRKGSSRLISVSVDFFSLQELLVQCSGGIHATIRKELLQGMQAQTGVSVDLLIEKAAQLVKDLSTPLGKSIKFKTEGRAGIRVPPRAIEALNIILSHLIRNAVDHGIEAPNERVAAGKQKEGSIGITVEALDSTVSVTVTDDGRGIDTNEVCRAAQERGIEISEGEKRDLLSLLCKGGVSTKSSTSSVSGRGIGIQAVRTQVQDHLGGSIALSTTITKGTVFEIRFNLLTIPYPVFPCKGKDKPLLVPQVLVEDFFPLSQKSIRQSGSKSYYLHRGKELPVKLISASSSTQEGVGVLIQVGEHRGIVWTESVAEEKWISAADLLPDLEQILSFIK